MNELERICWKISDYADMLKENDNEEYLKDDLESIVEYCKAIAYENGINLN